MDNCDIYEEDLIDRISLWSINRPKQLALVDNRYRVTYCELQKKSNYIGCSILNRTINSDAQKNQIPIFVCCKRNVNFIISVIGALKSGNYYIPIELPMPQTKIENILYQFSDYFIITDTIELFHGYDEKVIIDISNGIDETDIICHRKINMKEYYYSIFTSGTTGEPKCVMIRHESILNLLQNFLNRFYLISKKSMNVGVLSNFSFDASIKQIFGALYYGGTLFIAKKQDKMFSEQLQRFIQNNKINILDGTPTIYRLMMKRKKEMTWSVNYYLIGGEQLNWKLVNELEKYVGVDSTIVNVYGPTECCVDASFYIIDKNIVTKTDGNVSIGSPIECAKFRICDDLGREVSKGDVGELYISGKLVASGYYGFNSSKFFCDDIYGNTFKTGDLAKEIGENIYEVIGRKDEQVKINGNRVEILEVESLISNYIQGECVVCSLVKEGITSLYAFLGQEVNESELRKYLKERLQSYCIPKKIVFYNEAFPMNERGKIDKKKLLNDFCDL